MHQINRADAAAFVGMLGGVFEHSPWVAERAWPARPFADLEALHASMTLAVLTAERELQLALIRAHPELAGREAEQGVLSADSSSEQGRLGFSALPGAEMAALHELNRRYRAKFGFPCIIALRLHAERDSVLAEFARRLENGRESEISNALAQIGHIARGRLEKLIEDGKTDHPRP